MNTPAARPSAGGGMRGRIGGGGGAGPSTSQQPSTSNGGAATAAAGPAGEEEDEWSSGGSRPSFACDDRALGEMRQAVGSILESVGFTHSSSSALELLTDIGVRYMRKLATTANQTAEMDGRTRAIDADVIAGFRALRVNVDEMNEYMRQVRPSGAERMIPAFPLPIAPTPIVFTPVPAALIVPPPEMAFPGLPPMSTQWLLREDLEAMKGEKENEKEEEREERTVGIEEVKRMLSSFSGAESVPSFLSKSAPAFGLRKGDRMEDQRRGVGMRRGRDEMEEEENSRRRGEKRKGGESNKSGRAHKQFRPAAGAADTSSTWNPQQDEPCSSNSFAGSASYPNLQQLQQASRASSRSQTPSAPSGPISALRDSTRPVLTSANVPLAGALAPEYANTYTDGMPLRVPGLLAKFGRETSENREVDKQQRPSPRLPPAPRPPSPKLTEEGLKAPPPADATPTRLVQLAILRSLLLKDRPLEDQLTIALAAAKASLSSNSNRETTTSAAALPSPALPVPRHAAPAAAAPAPRKSAAPSIWPTAARAASSAAAAARPSSAGSRPGSSGSSRPHTPLPPPPPPAVTPRVVIKPPVKPPTPPPLAPVPAAAAAAGPVIGTPLPPLRLKISYGPRPSVDTAPPTPAALAAAPTAESFEPAPFIDDDGTSTAGPSSASTIPLMFSPATAAAAAAAAAEATEAAEQGEEKEGEEDEEGKKKKKKHKKEKKEKKEKKREKEEGEDGEERKKHKKEKKKKREKEEDDEEGENRSKSRSSAREVESIPSPAPPEGLIVPKLKIRLGPRPTE